MVAILSFGSQQKTRVSTLRPRSRWTIVLRIYRFGIRGLLQHETNSPGLRGPKVEFHMLKFIETMLLGSTMDQKSSERIR
jgi:hypothetical protein